MNLTIVFCNLLLCDSKKKPSELCVSHMHVHKQQFIVVLHVASWFVVTALSAYMVTDIWFYKLTQVPDKSNSSWFVCWYVIGSCLNVHI